MYKRQIYQIAESNRIEKIDSVAKIESNRIETFFAWIGMLYYLLPSRGDIPAFTPAEAGTRLSDPGGMQGWVDLVGWLQPEMVTSCNRARRALTSFIDELR